MTTARLITAITGFLMLL